ncbi:carboxypeptidase-like regulatory domain-containing protein [Tunturiibacter gelidiferens]|uniref:carboxypeptidase-like regulatory domain-containing protein n=1 Tax=Tunturiibacter gelidiferens TaxID=3069689 RepID=UPI003D9BF020
MMTIKTLFVLRLVSAVFIAAGQSDTGDARIGGHVYSPDGQPLPWVIVTIGSAQGNLNDQHELTSQDGRDAFARLEPGGYTITAFL